MALMNDSFDRLQEEYSSIRQENEKLYYKRLEDTYRAHPELKKADDDIDDLVLRRGLASLKGEDAGDISQRLDDAKAERERLIRAAGVDPSYRDRIYTCPYCRDTGFIEHEDGPAEKCGCFRRRESEVLLEQSGMASMLKSNNFSVMRTDIFSGEDREHFLKAVDLCRDFVDNFDSDYRNIMFCGTVGTGKSFLSGCIASELLASYHSVIYMSAKTLFDTLAAAQFSKEKKPEADAVKEKIYECDLLIIDDLGTEMTNSFVGTELFTIINERYNSRKSVIISTNLELHQLRDNYSDRIFSRLTGSYDILKLSGPDVRQEI